MAEAVEKSLYDEIMEDPRGRAELAVAGGQQELEGLFYQAFRRNTSISKAQVASILDVTEERIENLIEGEDRLTFEAFMRYTSVLGYRVHITLEKE